MDCHRLRPCCCCFPSHSPRQALSAGALGRCARCRSVADTARCRGGLAGRAAYAGLAVRWRRGFPGASRTNVQDGGSVGVPLLLVPLVCKDVAIAVPPPRWSWKGRCVMVAVGGTGRHGAGVGALCGGYRLCVPTE